MFINRFVDFEENQKEAPMEKEYYIVTVVKLKIWRFWWAQLVPNVFPFKLENDKEALDFFNYTKERIKEGGKKSDRSDEGEFVMSTLYGPSGKLASFNALEIFSYP